jgi:hypothetical protein
MEADSWGGLQYGGRFFEADFMWRWIMGADFNMESDFFMTSGFFFARKSKTSYSVSSFYNKGRSK